jgi:acylphosphatase
MLYHLHVNISGRVQGVGFRYFVLQKAKSLQLVGTVRNTSQGGVEVWAEGTKQALQQLVDELERGPAGSRVDRCEANKQPCQYRTFTCFEVTH